VGYFGGKNHLPFFYIFGGEKTFSGTGDFTRGDVGIFFGYSFRYEVFKVHS